MAQPMLFEEINDQQIVDTLTDDNSSEQLPIRYTITSYGADYTFDSLAERLNDGDIIIPDFQRGFVWDVKQQSRFIESLLLGLPVPGVFLSRESKEKRLLVIDGQQRLTTLKNFRFGGLVLKLDKTSPYTGLTYDTLPVSDRRELNDAIIHATIVRQNEPSDDQSSIYNIFERLNTGGVLLQPQEIRVAIYPGTLAQLLDRLNQNQQWREIYGSTTTKTRRRDQELILRFFALYYDGQTYQSPMKAFLNQYMGKNRNIASDTGEEMQALFEAMIQTVTQFAGARPFRLSATNALNAALFDAISVGVARRLSKGAIHDMAQMRQR